MEKKGTLRKKRGPKGDQKNHFGPHGDQSPHPLLQEKYTGLETARLWKPFFLSFLAKTKREQPLPGQVYGEIWPHSLQFWLHNFSNFWVKIGALVRPHLSSWTGFDLLIISGVNF